MERAPVSLAASSAAGAAISVGSMQSSVSGRWRMNCHSTVGSEVAAKLIGAISRQMPSIRSRSMSGQRTTVTPFSVSVE